MNPVVRDKQLLLLAKRQLLRAYFVGSCTMLVFLLASGSVVFHVLRNHLFAAFCWVAVVITALMALYTDGKLEDGLFEAYVALGGEKND